MSPMLEPLFIARQQMAFSMGAHIILACLGVGFPVLMLLAEGLALKKGDALWRELARRLSKAFTVLFAAGAISGTVLSFELGLFWPAFMAKFGPVIGLPFTLEAFAFFLESIFLGLYLYGWERLSPRAHFFCGIPIALAGLASACFVVCSNAWMNSPAGFSLDASGKLVGVDAWAAMFNPASAHEALHMALAAYIVTGSAVAAYYAWQRLRGTRSEYNRRALLLSLGLGCLMAPLQFLSGDRSSMAVARLQSVKLAAMEGQFVTERGAPLRLGGLEIPGMLSWMAYGDLQAEVKGLNDVPADERPPAMATHLSFQIMVILGSALGLLSLWTAWLAWAQRRKGLKFDEPWHLGAVLLSGFASAVALEAGWCVTEIGRQPWIAVGVMRTADAVTHAPGLIWVFAVTLLIYALLGGGVWLSLRHLALIPLKAKP